MVERRKGLDMCDEVGDNRDTTENEGVTDT